MAEETIAEGAPARKERAATIMVVAESAMMRLRSATLFREHGYEAIEMAAVRDALVRYAADPPQAVLLDGTTLHGHGLAAVRSFKSLDPAAKIALLTDHVQQETVVEAARAGVRDLIVKPFEPPRLLESAQKLLTPPDRRRHVRLPISVAARIGFGDKPTGYHPCVMQDLSIGGARCDLTPAQLPGDVGAGALAQLRFTLPDWPGLVLAVGHVARTIGPAAVGVAFVHVSGNHAEHIAAFCQRMLTEGAVKVAGSAA